MKRERSFAGDRTTRQRGKDGSCKGARGSTVLPVARDIGHMSYERGEASSVSEILESKTRRGRNGKPKSKAERGTGREGRVQASKVRIANETRRPSLESN